MLLVWVPVWPNPLEPEQHSFSHTITLSLVIAVRQVTHYEIQTVWMLWSQTAQRFELVKSSRTECWVAWFAAPSTFLRLDVNKLETLTPEIGWTFKKKFSRHILLKKKWFIFFLWNLTDFHLYRLEKLWYYSLLYHVKHTIVCFAFYALFALPCCFTCNALVYLVWTRTCL